MDEDPNRKCFRLVGGVLVERTVKDVCPALQTNREGVRNDSIKCMIYGIDQTSLDSQGDREPDRAIQNERKRPRFVQGRI